MTYPYRAARYQYGPRKGTLGLALHMSEGTDTLVSYLAGNPARGVSANFALLSTGEMWQMMPFETASGSMNPADRSTDKAYYGHKYLVEVLGDHWTDPNAWSISLEIAGFAAKGPNPAQVASIIDWAADMKRRFPTIRGAYGHADQTDTKGCPGSTAAMKGVFEAIGGHGLWKTSPQESDVRFVNSNGYAVDSNKRLPAVAGDKWLYLDGKPGGTLTAPLELVVLGLADSAQNQYVVQVPTEAPYPNDTIPRDTLLLFPTTRALTDPPQPPPVNCDAQREKDRVACLAAIEGVFA